MKSVRISFHCKGVEQEEKKWEEKKKWKEIGKPHYLPIFKYKNYFTVPSLLKLSYTLHMFNGIFFNA